MRRTGPLPLVFTDALFRFHPDKTLLPKSVAYVSLYLLGWSPLFWIVATTILSKPTNDKSREDKLNDLVTRILSPPVLASLLGLVVGSSKFLSSLIVGTSAPLNPVFEAMRTIGTGYLPAVLLVLAGSLSSPKTKQNDAAVDSVLQAFDKKETISNNNVEFSKQIIAVYLCRFFLIPSLAFGAVAALRKVTHPQVAF